MGTKFYKAQKNYNVLSRSALTTTVSVLLIFCSLSLKSQTNLSFTQISGDFMAPGRGAQNWGLHPWNDVTQPSIPAGNKTAKNYYTRFNWRDIESSTVQGSYSWSVFDNFVNQAIDAGAMFSFGVMPLCDGCGTGGAIPQYVVNLMSSEGKAGPVLGGVVYPNYQSSNWSKRYSALLRACANHIATTSRNGKSYASAFYGYDLRHAGNFGEFADLYTNSQYGSGAQVTDTYLNAMVDTAIAIFPDVQLTVPMGYFTQDGSLFGNSSGAPGQASAYKILTASNKYGRIGWRRDNIGDDGYNVYFTGNTGSFDPGSGSVKFQPLIMDMWKYAPIGGEPSTSQSGVSRCGSIYCDLHNENVLFHMSYFGNGNAPGGVSNASGGVWTQLQTNWRAGSAEQGYRLILSGGNMTTNLSSGGPFNITVNWQNIGNAPVYEKWNVTYELRKSDGTVVWNGNSSFTPRLFLPQSSATPSTDNFTLSAVASGTYNLYMVIRDPLNYKEPLPLAISGRGSDGSYLIRSNITVGTGGPVNQAPTVNAGGDKTIQLPTSSVSLTGTGADADGSIAGYTWTKVSGPASGTITATSAAATTVTGLAQGVYVYSLTVKDDDGATATDNIQITVNAAAASNQAPVATAGSDKTIQLPTSTVTLTGSGTDLDGSIASYSWTKVSGPAAGSITSAGTATTTITGLIQGVYIYSLTVTDNDGAQASDNIQVNVNALAAVNQPPSVTAGTDKTIQLPTNSLTLVGSGNDADGTIVSYVWAELSGPSSGTITSPNTATTSMTGLVQGVYVYTLIVTDNSGASSTDWVQVTVDRASNKWPRAVTNADQTITMPTNAATLSGTSSTDPDGSITAYQWTKISGSSQFSIGNTAAASTIVSNLTAGLYSFQLKVTDDQGAIALDTIKVTVNAAPSNQPPVANAGADMNITLPTNLTNLNGSASTDPDGTIAGYIWTQVSGPNTADLGSSASAATSVTGLVQGVYIFSIKVTDNNGIPDLDSVKVTVNAAPNVAPIANAGTSKTITLPVNSTGLNGSLSSDADGTITAYAWSQVSGPSTATITGSTLAQANAGNLIAGVYTFQLSVTDNSGANDNATVKITVAAAGVQPPVANAGADLTITLPTNTTTISGSASTASSGSIVTYAWSEKSGPSTVPLTNTVQNNLTNLKAGIYIFYLTVTDNLGANGTDSVIVTVKAAANQAPVADAGASINLTLPANTATLDGSKSSDPDGTISSYSWTRISGPGTPSITGANTAEASIAGLIAGTYIYQLTVTDNSGASSTAQVKVRVSTASNIIPIANAGANKSITSPVNTTTLDGSASADADGAIATYNWVEISGPGSPTINNSNTAKPSVTGLQVGSYVFELTVTDDKGASGKDQVSVTVLPAIVLPNQAPVANAGSNQTVTLPVNSVSLSGSSSFDPDGTITSFSWIQISGPTTAILTDGASDAPTAAQLIVGQYIFELTVTDNNGASNTDRINITVNPGVGKVNLSPAADAGKDDAIQLPTSTYKLDATKSTDPDGIISSYEWKQISGPNTAFSSTMSGAQIALGNLIAGTYVFEVTVTDDDGATSTADMTLTVEHSNHYIGESENRLTIYPNPAHSYINGRILSSITGTVKISLFDMNGKLVYSAEAEKTTDVLSKTLNISSLASGTYTILVNIANRKTMVSKFIKN